MYSDHTPYNSVGVAHVYTMAEHDTNLIRNTNDYLLPRYRSLLELIFCWNLSPEEQKFPLPIPLTRYHAQHSFDRTADGGAFSSKCVLHFRGNLEKIDFREYGNLNQKLHLKPRLLCSLGHINVK